jgi:hypothetical protein
MKRLSVNTKNIYQSLAKLIDSIRLRPKIFKAPVV